MYFNHFVIENYKFENGECFNNLAAEISKINDPSPEVQMKIDFNTNTNKNKYR